MSKDHPPKRVSALPRLSRTDFKMRAYEQAKSHWIAANPEATSIEYQAAMTRIAKEIGV